MKNYYLKFKHVFPTVGYISIVSVILLGVFRWLFLVAFEVFQIKEEVFGIWLPLAFPWIPMLIWLRPKLRFLYFKKEDDKRKMLFYFIVWLTTTPSLITSQEYLSTSTGKLTILSQSTELFAAPRSRYYQLNKFEVGRGYGGSYTDFRTSGKYNQYLNFDTYLVYPIVSNENDLIESNHVFWYGLKFKKQISNKLSTNEKQEEYNFFWKRSVKEFEAYDFKNVTYFVNVPYSSDKEGYSKAIETSVHKSNKEVVILTPKRESFENRNGNSFLWTFYWLGIGFGLFLLLLLWPAFNFKAKKGKLRAEKDEFIDALLYLIPRGQHFATSILLVFIIIVFLLMILSGVHLISPNGHELMVWGANRRTETIGGEWWRLITNTFLHGGLMHLISNIAGLVIAGSFVEPILGRTRYFIIYLLSGIAGSLASIFWHINTVSAGASGAIFGLYGAIIGLMLTKAYPKDERKSILIFFGGYIGINLLYGLTGGIDNAAHLGGLVSGMVLGPILYSIKQQPVKNSN